MQDLTNSRREFLHQGIMLGAISIFGSFLVPSDVDAQNPPPLEPAGTTSVATIVPAHEPGDPLIVSGRVFAPDGVRAVAGVVVYAYNTDRNGYYSPDGKVGHPR